MKTYLKSSFEQNPTALAKLLATGNATLTHTQDKTKWGKEFPKLLMEVREELRGTQPPTQTTQQIVEIAKTNYTKTTAPSNPNIGFIFTENAEMLDTNKNVSMTQAVIRTDKEGNKNPNALPIITKKLQVGGKKGQWADTEQDFNDFVRLNTELINRIKNSGYTQLVFPQGFATDKAQLPTRFAKWLQKALLNEFGVVTELNEAKTGLLSKSVKEIGCKFSPKI
jgi:hypothetical protein